VSMTYGAGTNGTGVGPHQARSIGGATQTYDANGNLTSGMGRTIAWNNENLPTTVTSGGVSETYGYNADSLRVRKVRSGVTTIYLEGLWEQTSSGTTRRFYTLNGQVVAVRTNAGSSNTVSYLHGDHLGSISVTTTASGTAEPRQEFDPWGKVRNGGVTTTTRNYTGQILDDTGLLFYNARYYDPAIGRFISGDTVVPGTPSGTMDGVAVKPLTVSFHEGMFLNKANSENKAPFWFQMDGDAKQQHGSPMGPANPQALNRYSYVQNNPLKYTDPTGHTVYMSQQEGRDYVQNIRDLARLFRDASFIDAFLVAIVDGSAAMAAVLIKYGMASAFVAAIMPGLAVAAAFLTLYGVPTALIMNQWAEQLKDFADLVSAIVERSPSGIIVANGCGNGPGRCGIVVASLDDGAGIHADLGPVGFFVGWGGIWSPGRPYNWDESKHYGKRFYRYDKPWED
jgi:RHS repeat-associated protein